MLMRLLDKIMRAALEYTEKAFRHAQEVLDVAERRLREIEEKIYTMEEEFRSVVRSNVIDEGDRIRIVIDLLEFRRENLKVYIEDHNLIVKATEESETGIRRFYKKFSLPSNIDINNIRASFRSGILEIVVPKSRVRRIKVE